MQAKESTALYSRPDFPPRSGLTLLYGSRTGYWLFYLSLLLFSMHSLRLSQPVLTQGSYPTPGITFHYPY
jgi:hypothetical protein